MYPLFHELFSASQIIFDGRGETIWSVSLFNMHTAMHTSAIIQMSAIKLAMQNGHKLEEVQTSDVCCGKYTFSAQPPCYPLSPLKSTCAMIV